MMTSYWDRSGRIPVSNTFSNLSGPDPKCIYSAVLAHLLCLLLGWRAVKVKKKGAISVPRGLSSSGNRMMVVGGRVPGH